LRDCSAVLFVAEATRRLFLADADPDRLVTLPYGLEVGAIDAARQALDREGARGRLGLAPTDRLLLCLGTVEPRKGQAMLVRAFEQVAARHPDARLALVGATEDAYCADYRQAIAEHVRRAGLESSVRMAPVTADPWVWHAAADLLVCASDIESLPRSIAEAMAFGTPVVSTRVYGVPELVRDGVDGWLCEPGDAAALAEAIDRALSAPPAALAAIAARASARVRERHDPARYAAQLQRLLEGLATDPDALPGELLDAHGATAAAPGP
jgi:glycosyltransferase involved in cell wall biosynthesis